MTSPWGLAFLPDGRMLVTQRQQGTLAIVSADGRTVEGRVTGVPEVVARAHGGLLDIALDPDYATEPWVYFSYAEAGAGGTGTAVARGRLAGTQLNDVTVLWQQAPKVAGFHHYGSRLAFRADKTLFVTLGDRFRFDTAQDLGQTLGKVVRINRDGSIPADNPAWPAGTLPGIWSYGHRNPQGAAIHPVSGELWITEHGPEGGDEINRVTAGGNFGWPEVSYGCHYDDRPIDDACRIGGATHAPAYVEPVTSWDPKTKIAPAGMIFYTGAMFPEWSGNIFFGAMADRALWRVQLDANGVVSSREAMFGDLNERMRDVRQAPDGAIVVLTDSGKLIRVHR